MRNNRTFESKARTAHMRGGRFSAACARVEPPRPDTSTRKRRRPRRFLLPLLLILSLGLGACAGTQVQVRGQHDFAIGGVMRR